MGSNALELIHNEMPRSPEPEGIIDESEDPAVIDNPADPDTPPRIITKVGTQETDMNQDRFLPVDRKEAEAALTDLKQVLKPRRNVKGHQYADSGLDKFMQTCLEGMKSLLWCLINPLHGRAWVAASLHVAQVAGRGAYFAKKLHEWTRAYLDNRSLPENPYGIWTESFLDTHKDLRQELMMYLQSVGKYVTAGHIVRYMQTPEVKLCWK